jgi:hypothetical protein
MGAKMVGEPQADCHALDEAIDILPSPSRLFSGRLRTVVFGICLEKNLFRIWT